MEKSETAVESSLSAPVRPKTSFAGDVLRLVSGTTIAQAISILVTPLVTRLYAPDAFGIAALFTSVTSILTVIACLRYELSILLPKSDEEATNLLGSSLLFSVLISLLTVPMVWWGRDPLLSLLNEPDLAPHLWLVPPMVFVGGVFMALNYWNSRTKHFGRLSVARVSTSVSTAAVKLGAGYMGFATGSTLISAAVVGKSIATAVLGGQILWDDGRLFLRSIKWRTIVSGVSRYRKFPLYGTWSALLNTISWQLPAFLLSAFFSSTVVGYYALGFRILQMPMSLIGNALGQVFFQRAAEARIQGKLRPVVEEVFRRLAKFGLFPILILTTVGSDIYLFLFGAKWTEAGVYTQILSVWVFWWFVSSPLSQLFSVLERQEHGLSIQIAIFATRLVSLSIGGYLGSARLAISLFSVSGILVYGYLSLWLLRMVGIPWQFAFKTIGFQLMLFAPAGAFLALLKGLNADSWQILGATLLSGVPYLIYLVTSEPRVIATFKRRWNAGRFRIEG